MQWSVSEDTGHKEKYTGSDSKFVLVHKGAHHKRIYGVSDNRIRNIGGPKVCGGQFMVAA